MLPTPVQDASVENSDSAEEVAWAPRQTSDDHANHAVGALGLPHSMRQETSAAINLMAMSFKADKARARPSPSPPALSMAVPQTDASVPFQDPQVGAASGPCMLMSADIKRLGACTLCISVEPVASSWSP